VLPFAQGAKIANPDLEIIAVGGDGDGLGIGAGHFVGAGRKNVDIPYLIFNNAVYGLTKGQASPTLRLGEKTKSLVTPNTSNSVNPIALALVSGFTFIARSYSYDVKHLKNTITKAITHKGLAFVDVLQPCPTYDDIHTREWYQGKNNLDSDNPKPRIYKIEEAGYDGTIHDESEVNEKMSKILEYSSEWGNKIPIGIFYQNELVPSYHERIAENIKDYFVRPPSHQAISDNENKPIAKIDKILDKLKIN
jgi:2-oxoglutarate ferredoxin oxidoreductase subunit beta